MLFTQYSIFCKLIQFLSILVKNSHRDQYHYVSTHLPNIHSLRKLLIVSDFKQSFSEKQSQSCNKQRLPELT